MDNHTNLKTYRIWAPVYDAVMRPIYGAARKRSIELLNLQPGETVLICGVGTGLDLPLIPGGVRVVGIDLSQSMLAKARTKATAEVTLLEMDAQNLSFPKNTFDAVIFNLILSVVPDGTAAFRQAWHALRPGGRAVIFDKFLPEADHLSQLRRLMGKIIRIIGTDPNRRLSDILHGVDGLVVERDEPSLLNGQYRIILLKKESGKMPD